MTTSNLYEIFSTDPVESNLQALKAKLAIALVEMVRLRDWTQAAAAKQLHVTQPRMSDLIRGKLDKFSIDALLQMLVRVGYKLETDIDPRDVEMPVRMTVKKAVL